jgi:transposase
MERHGVRHLTARERRKLEETSRTTKDVRVIRLSMAILHIDDGDHPEPVADVLGVSQMSNYRWIDRYNRDRSAESRWDRPRSRRPPLMATISDEQFDQLVEQSPLSLEYMAFAWTVPLLRGHIERSFGIRLSEETARRRPHRQDYR